MDDEKINQDNMLILDDSGDFKILNGEELLPYQNQSIQAVKNTAATVKIATQAVKQASNLPVDTGMEEKMLSPLPPTVRKTTASFYFHPSDEEEVSVLSKNFVIPTGKKYSLGKIAGKIIDSYHLNLNNVAKQKFEQIVFSFLRDRRTALETLFLFKGKDFSSAGLPENIADSLLDFLKEIKEKIQAAKGLVVNEELGGQADLPKGLSSADQMQKPSPIPKSSALAPSQPFISLTENERLSAQSWLSSPSGKELTEPPFSQLKPEPAKAIPQIKTKSHSFIPSGFRFTRPEKLPANQMTDVKKGYKLFGPVEELANLTLENFRRFANTPETRAGKILDRINILAKDSLIKKAAGLKAWRQSSLYKMYLAIGQASLEHNLEVKQVIAEYQNEGSARGNGGEAGKNILSMEEFEAITDLNRQLRF